MCPTKDTASFHQNAADASNALGRLNDAFMHYNRLLEIREMLHSQDLVREHIATVLYHLAFSLVLDRKPKEASETLEKLLRFETAEERWFVAELLCCSCIKR